jgi:hypothetical protein
MAKSFVVTGANGGTLEFSETEIQKGKNAGSKYFKPTNFENLRLKELLAVVSEEDLMEEIVLPGIAKVSLAATRNALKKAGDDDVKFQEEFSKQVISLSATGEPSRGLKKQIAELTSQLGEIVSKTPLDQKRFIEVATQIGELQSKYDRIKAEKEAEAETNDADATNTAEPVAA